MPYVTTDDSVRLYYEETGSGAPLVFVHEFAGDHRSWEPQMRYFGRYYRCIAYAARGFTPSDIPEGVERYSQTRAADDIAAVLTGLGIQQAHIVGLSMGGFATLHFGFRHAARALSLMVGGCGYGAEPGKSDKFREECETAARRMDADWPDTASKYALGPTRVQFQNKDPRGWQEFADQLAQHSAKGSANTMRGVQMRRPSLWDLVPQMQKLTVPTLIITGDEDEPCLDPALLMKRSIASAGLVILPKSGHTINLEEPDAFNRALADFLRAVEGGRWGLRDPRSGGTGILGFHDKNG